MKISKIKGYDEQLIAFKDASTQDFDILMYFNMDAPYIEDRDLHERNVDVVLKGKLGLIGYHLINISRFKVTNFTQWPIFRITDVGSLQWDHVKFKIESLESDSILGYAEDVRVFKPLPFH